MKLTILIVSRTSVREYVTAKFTHSRTEVRDTIKKNDTYRNKGRSAAISGQRSFETGH